MPCVRRHMEIITRFCFDPLVAFITVLSQSLSLQRWRKNPLYRHENEAEQRYLVGACPWVHRSHFVYPEAMSKIPQLVRKVRWHCQCEDSSQYSYNSLLLGFQDIDVIKPTLYLLTYCLQLKYREISFRVSVAGTLLGMKIYESKMITRKKR